MTAPTLDPCLLCKQSAENLSAPGYDGVEMRCKRCGRFKIVGSALRQIEELDDVDTAKVAGWIFDQNTLGECPVISTDRLKWLRALPMPSVVERADRLLQLAIMKQGRLGRKFKYADGRLVVGTYSIDVPEVAALFSFLESEGFVDSDVAQSGTVTPSGFIRADQLSRVPSVSAQGFVAMWFDEQMTEAYELGFERGISEAGYDPIRVDSVEHVGKIDDEIIAQIRKSRFIVADFTGHRAGVYFEAGFALGLDLPVIWTCQKDHISDLHFDIRQFNCIDWTGTDELATRLRNRIEAVIGEGPRKPIGETLI